MNGLTYFSNGESDGRKMAQEVRPYDDPYDNSLDEIMWEELF